MEKETAARWYVHPVFDSDGSLEGSFCVDTEEGATGNRLHESNKRFRDFVELAADWFWETDANLRYKFVSDQYEAATGLQPDSRLGHKRGDFRLGGPDDGDWDAHLADLEARRPFRNFRFAYLDANGRRRIAIMSGRPIFDDHGTFVGYRGAGRDITEEFNAQKQLLFLARHDALTGLPNRVMLKDRLEETLAKSRESGGGVAILSIDLDDFKLVNDTLGHAAGDALLSEAARRMQATVRDIDTAARIGGDEFIIVQAESTGWESARALAIRLIERLSEDVEVNSDIARCGVSIGISLYPDDGENVEELMRHADLALYRAKAQDQNSFCFFEPAMNEHERDRRLLEKQLGEATQDGSLFLQYQPQIEIKSGRIIGLEALVRWMRPGYGLVRPDEFISIAERSGLISGIDRWVLRQACIQAKAWIDAGLFSGRIAVNLSAILLAQASLVDDILETLQETRLPPDRLEIEITESVLLIDTETVATTLKSLSDAGISLAVDDFGVGYSSLTYLRRFPVHKVKIDRSFVRNVDHDADDAVITRAIISLGHSLGLQVIAEGVEEWSHVQFLHEAGCDQAQGYHFARPLSLQDCENYLNTAEGNARALPDMSGVVSLASRYSHY